MGVQSVWPPHLFLSLSLNFSFFQLFDSPLLQTFFFCLQLFSTKYVYTCMHTCVYYTRV